jgi:hypothetical protein
MLILTQGFTYVAPGLLDSAVSEAELLEQAATRAAGARGKGTHSDGDEAIAGLFLSW